MENIHQFIREQKELVISLQKELTKRPALSPSNNGDGELERANFLLAWMKENFKNASFSQYDCPDEDTSSKIRPNILALWQGVDSSKTFWIISHLDVVPTGDEKLWETPPFTLTQKDEDTLVGRGVEDNQQGIVSSIIMAHALEKFSLQTPYNLALLFVADEETGSKKGLEYLVKNTDLFKKNDVFLVPDHGIETGTAIEIAEKSVCWIAITVLGKQCHASTPSAGNNALHTSAALILALDELNSLFPEKNSLFSPEISTFSCTKIENNVENINTIPGKQVFCLDARILPEIALDKFDSALKNICDTIAQKYDAKISFEYVQKEEAAPATDGNHPFIQTLMSVIEKNRKIRPYLEGIGGGTVASFLRKEAYPVAVWASLSNQAHRPNEQSSISRTLADSIVMLDTALELKL